MSAEKTKIWRYPQETFVLVNFMISQKDYCIAGSPQTPLADSHFTRATYIRSH